ncbi:MAG: LPS export ABC transporter periplasmic protein LptC [Firmicutes bacterium]|nr:LPS export ABC transporter periplasmic protein LptC [Bacillota bacterium]
MNRFGSGLILILLACAGIAIAAEEVKVTCKNVWGDTEKKINYLEGDVRIVQGTTVITTERAQVDTDQKKAVFEAKVKLTHPEVTIEADGLEYDLKKKVGTFKKKVVMNRNRIKAAEGQKAKDPFKLFAEELYFETDTKDFTAQACRIEHRDFTGEAVNIEYNDRLQELWLKNNARLIRPQGEIIRGNRIKINISDKSFRVFDSVSVEFEVEEESG